MNKIVLNVIAAIAISSAVQAQVVKDRKNIDNLCGCFDVEFKYAETFSPDTAYKFHDREKITGGTELILPILVSDKKISMQHLLVVSDSMIIKHWREEWTYENPSIYKYLGDKVWKKETLSPSQVKGKWMQTVWEVSDEPRYQGISDWVNVDGKTIWQSTVDAPLPRREYSQRSDYQILKRTNRISYDKNGWLHEQDNQKIIRDENGDKLLVEEKGINSYKRIDSSKCAAAKAYWDKNEGYWAKVRATWDAYISTHNTIALREMVDGKVLHSHLFKLANEYATGTVSATDIDEKIKTTITKFLIDEKDVANKP